MKVFALVFLALGSAAALGSGPYLPSGWKPSGPAFYLPTESETQKPIPLKNVPVDEETSGSDSLREYGPPKEVVEVSQDITQQALPSAVTDQAFVIIEAKFNDNANAGQEIIAVEEKLVAVEESSTTSQDSTAEVTTESETVIKGRNIELETQTDSTFGQESNTEGTTEDSGTASTTEEEKTHEELAQKVVEAVEVQKETENANSNIVTAVESKTEEETVEEVKIIDEGVKKIAEALVNLENEINSQQIQTIQEVAEVRTILENSGSLQKAPEGFLEYGPPGFTEYGPPKEALRTSAVNENKQAEAAFETNETRRRRYSPKFKVTARKH